MSKAAVEALDSNNTSLLFIATRPKGLLFDIGSGKSDYERKELEASKRV